ncbi:LamG domain-containing protein [bacterium]|nr:LamG domain-containing protein [bacterium]
MSSHCNPSVVDDGLVFLYDVEDIQSYKGEPTTNIVPTPEANSRFTTSNNWQTYNTNQYNSNTYFSIGTISSVSNNIVTLGSVGRNIRSFDVLKPETTGGGVTAGTNYVIKKISSTTFSLHEYNNSQNGSQGYINPDTGFFKVHDAYANDTRISINATDFPTSWWGGPHLPNSGLIKEIVEGGGRVSGTNAMRLHVYREDNVADGMAYGVYCPVTAGDSITVSVYLKRADGRGNGKSIGYSTYFGSGNSASSTTFGPLTTEWERYTYTWTASTTFNFYSYWWPSTTSSAYAIDMCDFQVEINGHATQFTTGTRSATQGLLDRTGTSTINISNASFDSSAEMAFDGTDDYVNVDHESSYDTNVFTIEAWFKSTADDNTHDSIVTRNGDVYSSTNGWSLGKLRNGLGDTQNALRWMVWGTSAYTGLLGDSATTGNWIHAVGVSDGSTLYLYQNGVLKTSSSKPAGNIYPASYGLKVGANKSGSDVWNGHINSLKMYNKALTSTEVLQNFNATKSRFGL